jgi:hypothetical protein
MRKLIATTTKRARATCPGAIVGTGYGTALIELPEQRPIEASSELTIFNAPEKHGNPTGIGHAHLDYPVPTTYLVEAELEKVQHGRYGYRVEIDFPKIAGGYGSPISGRIKIDKKWIYKGMHLSVANARCADGRLQARIELSFEDGTFLQGSAFKRCTILHGPAPPARAPPAPAPTRPRLFDGQRAFHAGFAVAGDGAEVGVGARLEVDGGGVGAFGDQFGGADFFAAGVFDRDVVGQRLGVVECDRHFTGFRGHAGARVGEFAARVGFELDGRAAAPAAFLLAPAPGRRGAFVVARFSGAGAVVAAAAAGDQG